MCARGGRKELVTVSQNVRDQKRLRDGRLQRLRRQEPPTTPISTVTTATTGVTQLAEETIHPLLDLDGSGNRQLRYPVSLDQASPAALPQTTPAPSTAKAMNSPPLPTGQVPSNSTLVSNMASKPAPAIQSWTQKILIVAGSIGATLVIAFLIIVIYRWRKKKPLLLVGRRRKQSKSTPEPKIQGPFAPIPPWQKEWQNETLYAPAIDKNRWEFNSSSGSLLNKPQPAFSRPDTSNSNRSSPLAIHQTPSQSRFPPPNPLPAPLAERSVLFIDPRASRIQFSSMRRASIASSSPGPPIEGVEAADPRPSQKRRSSTPSITPSLSQDVLKELQTTPPKASRFSWTNSQAPKTPMDVSRFSIATSTSSVPRYRTVESWVGVQAGRLDESVFQGYLEKEIEERMARSQHSGETLGVTGTTAVIHEASEPTSNGHNEGETYASPPQVSKRYVPAPTRRTSKLRASDFMQHPGNKIVTPRVSLIPSEILDSRFGRTRESVI